MLGQAHHFRGYAPDKIEYAINRYTKEAGRLYGVMDRRLTDREYIAGEYSIADMAIYPWLVPYERQGQDLKDFPNLKRWFERMAARPALQKGMAVLSERRSSGMSDKTKEVLFGDTQYKKR
jgi:GST-like protein